MRSITASSISGGMESHLESAVPSGSSLASAHPSPTRVIFQTFPARLTMAPSFGRFCTVPMATPPERTSVSVAVSKTDANPLEFAMGSPFRPMISVPSSVLCINPVFRRCLPCSSTSSDDMFLNGHSESIVSDSSLQWMSWSHPLRYASI